MAAPHGTVTDYNILQKELGMLKLMLGRNAMTAAKTLSTSILSRMTTLDTALQAASINTGLSADPTLALRDQYATDPL